MPCCLGQTYATHTPNADSARVWAPSALRQPRWHTGTGRQGSSKRSRMTKCLSVLTHHWILALNNIPVTDSRGEMSTTLRSPWKHMDLNLMLFQNTFIVFLSPNLDRATLTPWLTPSFSDTKPAFWPLLWERATSTLTSMGSFPHLLPTRLEWREHKSLQGLSSESKVPTRCDSIAEVRMTDTIKDAELN